MSTISTVYWTSPVRRERRTKADIALIVAGLKEVLEEYNPMTVRQVFYQMTSRGYIPKTEQAYRGTVCRLLADLRLSGEIPFGWIADNTRWMRKPRTYDSMEDALRLNLETYRRAVWARMPVNVEVWIEKDALAGVIYDITAEWDVPLMVTRGYPSLSYVYEAAESMAQASKPTHIYYLGDCDPSGLDIARSVEDRLRQFAPYVPLYFSRIAVTESQIQEYDLPTRPTKATDTRARQFASNVSVELDALPPSALRELVNQCIVQHLDVDELVRLRKIEEAERQSLQWVVSNMRFDGTTGALTKGGA